MFPTRVALKQAIRALARTLERHRDRVAAGEEFAAWLDSHTYLGRAAPDGARSKVVTWTAAEEWPGSIEWYTLDDSVIGRPERGGLFYEIPFADLARMPLVVESPACSRKSERARS
ncbi:MAG TPA: hypothetical protein VNV25_07665 [Gemmatimonadaceae bacterium]|nr:hypothetical protein [Gemmatimonadaceae bacterium]